MEGLVISKNPVLTLGRRTVSMIRMLGRIGDRYIKLSAGGSEVVLGPGDIVIETEAVFDFEEIISK